MQVCVCVWKTWGGAAEKRKSTTNVNTDYINYIDSHYYVVYWNNLLHQPKTARRQSIKHTSVKYIEITWLFLNTHTSVNVKITSLCIQTTHTYTHTPVKYIKTTSLCTLTTHTHTHTHQLNTLRSHEYLLKLQTQVNYIDSDYYV